MPGMIDVVLLLGLLALAIAYACVAQTPSGWTMSMSA